MKKIFLLLLISFSSAIAFAAPQSYFMTYGASYNVDLSDTTTFRGTTVDKPNWESPGYNSNTLIAVIGVAGTTDKVNVTFNFKNGDWVYRSASQPNLERKFGLDLVLRSRWETPNARYDSCDRDDTTESVTRLGYHDNYPNAAKGDSVSISFDNRTDGNYKESERHMWHTDTHELVALFFDVSLVLPEIDPNDNVGSADDYYASFDMTFEGGGVSITYHCEFTGYYQDNSGDDVKIMLNVVPNSNASSINLDETSSILSTATGLDVGTYSYMTTNNSGTKESSKFYAFVSSSQSPQSNNVGEFTLIKDGLSQGTQLIPNTNSIKYEIGLYSGKRKTTKWFDGTDSYTSTMSNDDANTKFFISQEQTVQRPGDKDSAIHYQRYDDGTILFRLASGADPTYLEEGTYSSYVYFHVLSSL